MSYEDWIDSKVNANERGLSLKQAYEAGQLDADVTLRETCAWEGGEAHGRILGRKEGQREMLEKVTAKWDAICRAKKEFATLVSLAFDDELDQLAEEIGDE